MKPPIRIAHIIADLNGFGGTEATLLRYVTGSSIPLECHRVIVLKTIGTGNTLGAQMVAAGVSVVEMNQKRGLISLKGLYKVFRELKAFNPDVISGWLYHSSLLATIIAPMLKSHPAVVWHIRSLTFSSITKTPGRYVVQRILAVLSRCTDPVIASNSSEAMRLHAAIGIYGHTSRTEIVPNGIDADHYHPDQDDGVSVRLELGIPKNAIVIGCVGRFVPEKGYPVFFEALNIVREKLSPEVYKRIHFLGAGNGVSAANPLFMEVVSDLIAKERVTLLDKRDDVPRLLRAVDVFVLPSISEAFPNSLIEAMASGLACIATDVGQSSDVLTMPDYVIPPADSLQLADRIMKMVMMTEAERSDIGRINRQRVISHFGVCRMVQNFDNLFNRAAINRYADEPE